ncbi:MAG: hypothetical protein CME63_15445 [Halobacteriovoraceae bacterium]|nr:hypothetical protein [Halobacteriovoraceae bacterium]|tara:strand:- start:197882 stop:199417 length:1536 start_codon:yes stop_codon:yes gene_type:complete
MKASKKSKQKGYSKMAGNFQKTTSNFFVTFLIGLIVVSFMFTGVQSMNTSPNAVAKVGSYPISAREYQMEYNRQLNFFKNYMMQGKDLSSQDIERFGIKNASLKNLVQRKLQLIFADKADVVAAPAQVKKQIKEFEFFQTNGQFDINKYKELLRANGLTPQDFEEDITNQVYAENSESFFSMFPISEGYLDDIAKFKAQRYNGTIVEIPQSAVKKRIKVSSQEIEEFLKKEVNKARTESIFKQRKASLDVPEQVKASHILIRVTDTQTEEQAEKKIQEIAKKVNAKNFKTMANRYTEEESGKGKGGSLGLFSKGRMVPEFEQVAFSLDKGQVSEPVKTAFGYHLIYVEDKVSAKEATFDKYKKEITTELIQDSKEEELKELMSNIKTEVLDALRSNDSKKLETLKSKYAIKVEENVEFNRYEGNTGRTQVASSETKVIFDELKKVDAKIFDFDLATKTQIIALERNSNKDIPPFDRKKEMNGLQMALSNKLKKDVLKEIGDNTPVKQFVQL